MFDTEPRTWQLDFDEFCHWLETGERSLNRYGVSANSEPADTKTPVVTQGGDSGRSEGGDNKSEIFSSHRVGLIFVILRREGALE